MPSTSVAVRWHGGPSCDMFLEHLCLVWSQNWDCKVVQPPSVLLWSRTKHCQLFFDYQILPWWKAGNTLSPILAGVPCRLANSLACQSQSIPAPNWEIIRKCTGATSMAYLNSRAQTVLYCFILFLDAQNADVLMCIKDWLHWLTAASVVLRWCGSKTAEYLWSLQSTFDEGKLYKNIARHCMQIMQTCKPTFNIIRLQWLRAEIVCLVFCKLALHETYVSQYLPNGLVSPDCLLWRHMRLSGMVRKPCWQHGQAF